MGRPSKKPHEVVPVRRGAKCYANFGGRPFYLGRWDVDKDEPTAEAMTRLEELRKHWLANPEAVTRQSKPGDKLLAELWAEWRASPEANGRMTEQAARAERFLFGTADLPGRFCYHRATQFGGVELREFQRALCDAKLLRDSVTKTIRCVRSCFAWGLIGKVIPYEQFRELELVEPPAKGGVKEAVKRKGITWEMAKPAVAYLSPPLATVTRLLWLTGARPGELLSLRVGDLHQGGALHTDSGIILDLSALGVWAAVKVEHKTDGTGYDRVIFFGPQAQQVLTPLLDNREATDCLFQPTEGRAWDTDRKRAARLPGNYGTYKKRKGARGKRQPRGAYDSHVLTTAVRRACERAGGASWTPYQLRHQVGRLVQQRFGRDASRVFLGHQVGGVTERYAGADLEAAAKVAKEWG